MEHKFIGRIVSVVLTISMVIGGCSIKEKVAENKVETTENIIEQKKSTVKQVDTSVMKPWINSSILGLVTDDVNADIKDDFFLNVNHDWLRDAKLRPGLDSETPIYDALDIVKNRCIEFLNDKNMKFDDPTLQHDIEMIQNYYNHYLDWDSRNAKGVEPLKPLVEKIQAISNLDEMSEFLLSEEATTDSIELFTLIVGVATKDSSSYAVFINTTDLSLGDSDEYKTLTENGKRMKKSAEDMTMYILKRIGFDDKDSKELVDLSYAFEQKVSNGIMGTLETNDSDSLLKTINYVSMDDIKNMEGKFPLSKYMEKYGFSVSNIINLNEPKWLEGMKNIYIDENLEEMKAYLLTKVVRKYIDKLDETAFRKYQEITNTLMGITESMSDEELAYNETRKKLPYCFDRIYINKYLTAEMKKEITSFCEESIEVYRELLNSVEWMSDETKKAAINKLNHITIHAIYPEKWEDDSIFQISSKENGGSYIEAQKAIVNGLMKRQLSYINQKVDKDIWGIDILDTDAYYNPTDNSINIIPGYFCKVTYNSDMSIEEKYGAIGTVIGHEISHAFDTYGSQFDEIGNVKDWWTKEDKVAFRDIANKLVEYYDNVVAFDNRIKYSGQMVQTESIADIAGLKCMLMLAKKVPNFDYDKFFRANARLWSRVYTLEKAEAVVLTNTHPLHYLRCNVSLQQYDEFLETYDIKEGDGMYLAPEDRITVW